MTRYIPFKTAAVLNPSYKHETIILNGMQGFLAAEAAEEGENSDGSLNVTDAGGALSGYVDIFTGVGSAGFQGYSDVMKFASEFYFNNNVTGFEVYITSHSAD